MPRRIILTEKQRDNLLSLLTDTTSMLRYYVLSDEDLAIIKPRQAFQAQTANFSEVIERLIILGETQGSITQCIQ